MRANPAAAARMMSPDRWVERWARRVPDKPALVFRGRTITYRELAAEVRTAAAWLRSVGVGRGDRVGCWSRNDPAVVVLYLACCRTGAVFVPWNVRLAPAELAFQAGETDPVVVLVQEDLKDRVPPGLGAAWFAAGGRTPWAGGPETVCPAEGPDDPEAPQAIVFTSGTTGRPKGAVLPVRKGFFNALNALEFLDLRHGDRVLLVLPLFHSGGLFIQLVPALYQGCTVLLHPRFDPGGVARAIEQDRASQFVAVPTMVRRVLDAVGAGPLARLRVLGVGGEPVPPELAERCLEAGVEVRPLMGQTETSIFLWASARDLARRPGTVGRPVYHAEVRVGSDPERPARPGEPGEIWVRGPTVFSGYWNESGQTASSFQGEWLRTGDLARTDEEGYFHVVGRAKDMYISGGENVYPAEVEAVLRQHPAVREAAVVGVPDPTWGEVGHAAVEVEPGAVVDPEALLAWCAERLARFKCPRYVSLVERLPRTELGKIHKAEIRRALERGDLR